MDQYPTLNLIVRHGEALAAASGLLPLLGAIAAFVLGTHWVVVVAGAVAGAGLEQGLPRGSPNPLHVR